MAKRRAQMRESESYDDDNAIFYTCLGFLIASVFCAFAFWACDYVGMLDVPAEPPRPQVEPVPVLIPEFEGVEQEEYESLIEQNPPRSYTSNYITI